MALASPLWLLLLLILPLLWLKFKNKQYVGFSDKRLMGRGVPAGRILFHLPMAMFTIAFVLLVWAMARPQEARVDGTETIKTRDILVAVDISGSMGSGFEGQIPPPEKGDTELDRELPEQVRVKPPVDQNSGYGNAPVGKRRIDAAQSAVTRFVRNRFIAKQSDRIGIMAFDTEPHWSWPLTDDLKMIYRKGVFIDAGLGGGTNFGRDPGPMDAAAEHFDERGKAATKVLILVTDGEDSIYADDFARLVDKLSSRGVRLYVIGVGETLARRDTDLMRLAQTVGGQVFRVENANELATCFDTIDQMERTDVKVQTLRSYHDVFYYYVFAALAAILIGALAEAFIISR